MKTDGVLKGAFCEYETAVEITREKQKSSEKTRENEIYLILFAKTY